MAQPRRSILRRLGKTLRGRTSPGTPAEAPVPSRSPKSRRVLAASAVTVATALTVAGCTAGASTTNNSDAPALIYSPCCSWNPQTYSYNPWNVNPAPLSDFVFLRLAVQDYPSITKYEPELASSWDVSGQTITVHLAKQAKWQDGSKVTGKDLYDTVLLNGLNGAALWNDITDVKVVDDSTVAFTLRPGQPVALAEQDLLMNTLVYPSSVYGKFVTPQVEKDVPAYYAQVKAGSKGAASSPQQARNASVFQQLAAYDPKTVVGDGPYRLTAMTGAEAQLVKWDGFWLADKINVPKIKFTNNANEAIYPQLFSDNVDFTGVYLPPPLLKRWKSTAGSNLALPPAFGYNAVFNNALYPLNITAVRQALAYAMPRKDMISAAFGTEKGSGGVPQQYLTGFSPQQNATYLTKDQLAQLNPYDNDTAKAASLLTGAGFTKKNGEWYTPKGVPFTLSFEANSSTSNVVTSFTAATKALTEFGIKSSVNATSGAQVSADLSNGNFQVIAANASGATPLLAVSALLHDQNFLGSGNYAGKRGLGFGPTADVPGLGTVNIADTIFNQSRSVGPGAKLNELSWDWAQLVNQQVPYIWYGTKSYQFSFSTNRYTDWPPIGSDGTSTIWNMASNNTSAGFVYALTQGYIKPKK